METGEKTQRSTKSSKCYWYTLHHWQTITLMPYTNNGVQKKDPQMRFKLNLTREGTFQDRKVFAWLPTRISTREYLNDRVDTIVWLEFYTTEFHYTYGSWRELTHRRRML